MGATSTEPADGAPSAGSGRSAGAANARILGDMCWLCSRSRLHRTWPMGSLRQWLIPAIVTRQVRLYVRNGRPHSFVTWARLSKRVGEAYARDRASLAPGDWQSGGDLWFIDWVAPFGGTREMASDLRRSVFPDEVGRYLRLRAGSDRPAVLRVQGASAAADARQRAGGPAAAGR